jgi:hypothetical protein
MANVSVFFDSIALEIRAKKNSTKKHIRASIVKSTLNRGSRALSRSKPAREAEVPGSPFDCLLLPDAIHYDRKAIPAP